MSKTKSPPASVEAPAASSSDGWKIDLNLSGTLPLKARLEFNRPPSAVVRNVDNSRRVETDAAVKDFLANDPATKRYVELKDRLARAKLDLAEAESKHDAAKAEFVADPRTAPALEVTVVRVSSLKSQVEALGGAVVTALDQAKHSYSSFQSRHDSERIQRLRAEALALAEKIERAVAPLLSEFGAARKAIQNENRIVWPQFDSLFPEPAAATETQQPVRNFADTAGPQPVIKYGDPSKPPADPNWIRSNPPVMPAMVSCKPEQEE